MGAGDINRVKKTTRIGLRLNLLITFIVVIFVQLFAGQIIRLFEPESTEVIKDGILYTDTSQDMKSSLARRMRGDGRRQIFFQKSDKNILLSDTFEIV